MLAQKLENTCSMKHIYFIDRYTFKGDWRTRLKEKEVYKLAVFVVNWTWFERLKYLPFAVKKVHTYLGYGDEYAHVCVVDVRTPMERLKIWLKR